MDSFVFSVFGQLLSQVPNVIAYIVGLVFALVLRRKYPVPSLLVLIGTAILLVETIVYPFVFGFLFDVGIGMGWEFGLLYWGWEFFHAAGIGLILAAAFVGRTVERWRPKDFIEPSVSLSPLAQGQAITSQPTDQGRFYKPRS